MEASNSVVAYRQQTTLAVQSSAAKHSANLAEDTDATVARTRAGRSCQKGDVRGNAGAG